MKKSFFMLGLILMVCFSGSGLVYADTDTEAAGVNGDMTIEEGAMPFIQSVEDQNLEKKKDIEAQATIIKNEDILEPQTADRWVIIPTTVFKQENGYYCGPATVKEVIHAIKGSSSSQSTYAKALGTTSSGTDMTKIAPLLKSKTGKSYVMSSIKNQSTWKSRIATDMGKRMPVVMDIKTTTSFWKYKTDGHFLPIVGANQPNSNFTKVRLADPHYKYYGTYNVTAANAYKANNNHWRKSMIW